MWVNAVNLSQLLQTYPKSYLCKTHERSWWRHTGKERETWKHERTWLGLLPFCGFTYKELCILRSWDALCSASVKSNNVSGVAFGNFHPFFTQLWSTSSHWQLSTHHKTATMMEIDNDKYGLASISVHSYWIQVCSLFPFYNFLSLCISPY